MPDFYADFPFGECRLQLDDATICTRGDVVMGMKDGAQGRVERIVDGEIVVHRMKNLDFLPGDTLVTPRGHSVIREVGAA